MTTAATSLLGLALPVTGELSGTWGDTVNNSITSLLDTAVAGTTTLSTDADVTLTTTTLASNQARQAILLCSGARTALRTITAPAQSKIYTIINATTGGYSVKLVGVGPTTGLTIPNGASAVVAWNGSDFIEVGSATVGNLTVNGNLSVTGTTSLTGVATLTANPVLSAGTANGVAYLNGSKVVTTGSALVFDGTNLTTNAIKAGSNAGDVLFGRYDATYPTSGIGFFKLGTNNYNADTGGFNLYTNNSGTLRLSYQAVESGSSASYHLWNASGSEGMRLTSTGLGIGTSSPLSKLDIKVATSKHALFLSSTGYSNGADLVATNDTGSEIALGLGGDTVNFYTGATRRMLLDSSGNLGLGVTPSAWAITGKAIDFSVYGTINSLDDGTKGNFQLGYNYYQTSASTFTYKVNDAASMYRQRAGVHSWWNAPAGTGTISFTQAMTLDASGQLGVGETSPNAIIAAKSTASRVVNINSTNASGAGLAFANSGADFGYIGSAKWLFSGTLADVGITTSGATNLILGTNNAERARITSGGYFKASNTGAYQSSTSSYHELYNDANTNTVRITNAKTSGYTDAVVQVTFNQYAPNDGTAVFLWCNDTSAVRAKILSNGGIANYSANNVNLSDLREKINFSPAKSYLDVICAIPVQTFNYIDQSEDDPGLTLGVVAQDVQAVAPELVMESNWAKEGDEPKMRLSIYQTDLQYALMKCIQEQQAIIDTLTARITALEAK